MQTTTSHSRSEASASPPEGGFTGQPAHRHCSASAASNSRTVAYCKGLLNLYILQALSATSINCMLMCQCTIMSLADTDGSKFLNSRQLFLTLSVCSIKNYYKDFSGGLVVKDTTLPLQGSILIGKLRSHMPHNAVKK